MQDQRMESAPPVATLPKVLVNTPMALAAESNTVSSVRIFTKVNVVDVKFVFFGLLLMPTDSTTVLVPDTNVQLKLVIKAVWINSLIEQRSSPLSL